jgi:hypothetical protein
VEGGIMGMGISLFTAILLLDVYLVTYLEYQYFVGVIISEIHIMCCTSKFGIYY